jgi:predicted metal-dependent hydrolase
LPLPEAPPTGHLPFPVPEGFAPDLEEFWTLWRQERFWACHEALEEVWREQTGPRKWFLGGLINGAVAVFQHRRGNFIGAARQLRRAQTKLEAFLPVYEGLDVAGFLQGVAVEVENSLVRLNEKQRAGLDGVERSVRERIAASGSQNDS